MEQFDRVLSHHSKAAIQPAVTLQYPGCMMPTGPVHEKLCQRRSRQSFFVLQVVAVRYLREAQPQRIPSPRDQRVRGDSACEDHGVQLAAE
jgi:hypothetical protein